jgi:hypothetical protein
MALVHVPVFLYKYEFNGQTFTALVDAASGTRAGQPVPAQGRSALPAGGHGHGAGYLCLALAPLVGALSDVDGTALMIGGGCAWGAACWSRTVPVYLGLLGGIQSMTTNRLPKPLTGLACPRCGGMVTIPEGQAIVICPYCDLRSSVSAENDPGWADDGNPGVGVRRYQAPCA